MKIIQARKEVIPFLNQRESILRKLKSANIVPIRIEQFRLVLFNTNGHNFEAAIQVEEDGQQIDITQQLLPDFASPAGVFAFCECSFLEALAVLLDACFEELEEV